MRRVGEGCGLLLACLVAGSCGARSEVESAHDSGDAGASPNADATAPQRDSGAVLDGAMGDAAEGVSTLDASVSDDDGGSTLDASVPEDVSSSLDAAPYDGGPGWWTGDAGVAVSAPADGGSPTVKCMALTTVDMVVDPRRGVLYATVPATAPSFGNGVVRIDPSSAMITGSVFVGSNADALAISDDAASLYVGIDGAASVCRVDVASGSVDPPVYLGSSSGGARTAGEIRAVPGSPTQYVVSRRLAGYYAPGFDGLALFDGPTPLAELSCCGGSIAFVGRSNLYAYNNDSSGFDLYELTIASTGFQFVRDTQGVFSGFSTEIASQDGWIFGTDGVAVSASTMQIEGQYAATGPLWADADETNVWYLTIPSYPSTMSGPALLDFDRTTFILRRSFSLPTGLSASGEPASSLVRWSPTGFAFRTSSAVCIVTVPTG